MAKNHGSSVKDDKTYEGVRKSGASKEKAARIANAKAGGGSPSKRGGKASKYEDQTKEQLQKRASQVGIEGRSKMSKGELAQRPPQPLIRRTRAISGRARRPARCERLAQTAPRAAPTRRRAQVPPLIPAAPRTLP